MFHRQLKHINTAVLSIFITTPILADPPAANRKRDVQDSRDQNMITEVTGKLKSLEHGVLVVIRDDGTEVLIKPPSEVYKLQFVAEAKPQFLQQGMMVRFTGSFNQAGVAQSPIARVELFQPINGKVPGHVRRKYYPGVYPDPREAKKQAETGIAKCGVVGSLVGIDQSGLMSVRAGKIPVRIPLVQNAKFEIRYNNLALAKSGDSIRVAGFYNPPDETKVLADSVTITTDRVYGAIATEESKPKPKKRRPRRSRRNEKQETKEDVVNPAGETGNPDSAPEPKSEAKSESEATPAL
jgi:hypothetical protein